MLKGFFEDRTAHARKLSFWLLPVGPSLDVRIRRGSQETIGLPTAVVEVLAIPSKWLNLKLGGFNYHWIILSEIVILNFHGPEK